jgi:glycosyltransferase involved in cell wall biosynthesis
MDAINKADFDVIITTYCRYENIEVLANQVLELDPAPKQLIIVDTSPIVNKQLQSNERITYIRSNINHQNQPYKRLVGARVAKSDKIIFFDDDMEILDRDIFKKTIPLLNQDGVVAFTSDIDYQEFKKSIASPIFSILRELLLFVTGRPIMGRGKIGLAGYHGTPRKDQVSEIEALSGPFMGFKKEVFLKLADKVMLTLFDLQLIIPEDKLLSIKASEYGKLLFYPEQLVKHPKIVSTYFLNMQDHTKRVHFSRFIINRELVSNNGIVFKILYDLHFLYYSFWRLIIAYVKCLWKLKKYQAKAKGIVDGIRLYKDFRLGKIKVVHGIIEDSITDSLQYEAE